MPAEVLIFGAGGHAKVVVDVLLNRAYREIKIFDDNPAKLHTLLLNYTVIGQRADLIKYAQLHPSAQVIIAVGHNETRKEIYQECVGANLLFISAIHPTAVISNFVTVGQGVMIMANAVINPSAHIGNNVIINTGAVVEHDVVIADHVHIASNATVCGGVSIGESTVIGSGAVVLPGIKVGRHCMIEAGAVICRDLSEGEVFKRVIQTNF